ncbi:DNA-formamidopyrimidine glycosylase family protein [Geomesophilobacter sediminis]|uniref:Formamidopyrimidine-DNA glycosylase n=1 Tax=Geomesophilobacter sediminis TaxID=2798584 RepID=A0A8J7IYW2_9BACT|nr:DNA-formamidopyrimidine glycosylase family protein [Geomesophilobacter sediminis]MBJ6723118.1 formamidopyrimidine-DNA glycosylase [Geomesophilobacter sediminis]
MPELPDLTVFAQSLQKLVLNRGIVDAAYLRPKRLNVPPETFRKALVGHRLTEVRRVGKEILFVLDDGACLTVMLMLAGGFAWSRDNELPRSPILTIRFDSQDILSVTDPQSLVMVNLNPDLSGRAPDALEITPALLAKICRSKPRSLVKALLIDQKLIGGIGNAYSDEILWRARIAPHSLAGKLPDAAVEELAHCIVSVLTDATKYLEQHHPGILAGEVRDFLSVHGRSIKSSPTGRPVIVEQIASKRTYYTDEQILYR